mmetsp:Transcript_41909/g.112253  ORF Transcript_41909/g.112253 Transcript_41909/m.112253 type:complete len:527 (+) Transcript_41909:82-1662(+)
MNDHVLNGTNGLLIAARNTGPFVAEDHMCTIKEFPPTSCRKMLAPHWEVDIKALADAMLAFASNSSLRRQLTASAPFALRSRQKAFAAWSQALVSGSSQPSAAIILRTDPMDHTNTGASSSCADANLDRCSEISAACGLSRGLEAHGFNVHIGTSTKPNFKVETRAHSTMHSKSKNGHEGHFDAELAVIVQSDLNCTADSPADPFFDESNCKLYETQLENNSLAWVSFGYPDEKCQKHFRHVVVPCPQRRLVHSKQVDSIPSTSTTVQTLFSQSPWALEYAGSDYDACINFSSTRNNLKKCKRSGELNLCNQDDEFWRESASGLLMALQLPTNCLHLQDVRKSSPLQWNWMPKIHSLAASALAAEMSESHHHAVQLWMELAQFALDSDDVIGNESSEDAVADLNITATFNLQAGWDLAHAGKSHKIKVAVLSLASAAVSSLRSCRMVLAQKIAQTALRLVNSQSRSSARFIDAGEFDTVSLSFWRKYGFCCSRQLLLHQHVGCLHFNSENAYARALLDWHFHGKET